MPLSTRHRRDLGLEPCLLKRPDDERAVERGDRLVGDHGNPRVPDLLEQALDCLLRRASDDDRVRVAPLGAGDELGSRHRQLDRVDRVDQVPAQDFNRHAGEYPPLAARGTSIGRLIERMILCLAQHRGLAIGCEM